LWINFRKNYLISSYTFNFLIRITYENQILFQVRCNFFLITLFSCQNEDISLEDAVLLDNTSQIDNIINDGPILTNKRSGEVPEIMEALTSRTKNSFSKLQGKLSSERLDIYILMK